MKKNTVGKLGLAGLVAVGTVAGCKEKEIPRETVWLAPIAYYDEHGYYRERNIAEFYDIDGKRKNLRIIEHLDFWEGNRWVVSIIPYGNHIPKKFHIMLNHFPDLVKAYQNWETRSKIITEEIKKDGELVGLSFKNYETGDVYGQYSIR